MDGRSQEITLLEDLDGFSRDKADPRMAKFMLEMVQSHYPGRLGDFIAFNAPWYYRLIFKIVKPWLSAELVSKVNILGSASELKNFIDTDQLLPEWGGTFKFDLEKWIEERYVCQCRCRSRSRSGSNSHSSMITSYQIENVQATGDQHRPADELVSITRDMSVTSAMGASVRRGWLLKEGGYVKQWNKRYAVLCPTVLFYFKGESVCSRCVSATCRLCMPLMHSCFCSGLQSRRNRATTWGQVGRQAGNHVLGVACSEGRAIPVRYATRQAAMDE
jgi:hypothetical protein